MQSQRQVVSATPISKRMCIQNLKAAPELICKHNDSRSARILSYPQRYENEAIKARSLPSATHMLAPYIYAPRKMKHIHKLREDASPTYLIGIKQGPSLGTRRI